MDTDPLRPDAGAMAGRPIQPRSGTDVRAAASRPTTALFWRLFLATGLVFVIAAALLVFSPVTVSAPIALRELAVDRKSTRLNSSHANISYAVFCLKKKKYIVLRLT